jgi:hypothetical protein
LASGCQHSGRWHSQGRSQQSFPTTIVVGKLIASNPPVRREDLAGFEARRLLGARRAFQRAPGRRRVGLRQSLIDLASVCELLADELPAPTA